MLGATESDLVATSIFRGHSLPQREGTVPRVIALQETVGEQRRALGFGCAGISVRKVDDDDSRLTEHGESLPFGGFR